MPLLLTHFFIDLVPFHLGLPHPVTLPPSPTFDYLGLSFPEYFPIKGTCNVTTKFKDSEACKRVPGNELSCYFLLPQPFSLSSSFIVFRVHQASYISLSTQLLPTLHLLYYPPFLNPSPTFPTPPTLDLASSYFLASALAPSPSLPPFPPITQCGIIATKTWQLVEVRRGRLSWGCDIWLQTSPLGRRGGKVG